MVFTETIFEVRKADMPSGGQLLGELALSSESLSFFLPFGDEAPR